MVSPARWPDAECKGGSGSTEGRGKCGAKPRSFSLRTSGNDGGLRWFGFFFGLLSVRLFLLSLLFVWFLFAGFFVGFRFFLALLLFFEKFLLFFFARGTVRDVALAVEIDAPVDQSFLHDSVSTERVVIVNDEVGVFAGIDGANVLVDAQLDGGIDGDHLQRFVMRKAAKLDALGGFLIEVGGFFGVVGVNGNENAAPGHERGIVGNGVVGFDFVGPPIGKGGSAGARGGDFVGNFVTFQDVLEGADFEAEFLSHAQQHQDFVFAVAMRMYVALTFENFDKRLEAQIAARGHQVLAAGCYALVVGVPGRFVVARFGESAANGFFHAHAGGGIAHGSANTEIGALGIFAERKLDAGQRAIEGKLGCGLSPAQFDHHGLPADSVRAAVQDIRSGDAAGEIAIDRNVVGIQNVSDVDDRRNGNAAFIDAAIHGDVRMAINNPWDDKLPGGIDHLRIFRSFDAGADFHNFAVLDQDRAVFDGAVGNSEDGGVLNQEHSGSVGGRSVCGANADGN